MKKLAILLIIAFLSQSIYANGYSIPLLSHKYNGMGHVGTALYLDASVVYFNPAGMSFLEKNQLNFGAFGVDLKYNYRNPITGYEVSTINDIQTPFHVYGAWRLKGKFNKASVGFGIYTPFGSAIKYPKDWAGRFVTTEFSLKTIFFQPTASYKIREDLSIGIGLIIGYGAFGVQRAIPISENGVDAFADLSAKSVGVGFEIGMMYQPKENLTVGFRYSSKSTVSSNKGKALFTNVPSSVDFLFPQTTFSAKLTIPQILSLGLAYKIKQTNTLIAADIIYTNWRVYNNITINFAQPVDGNEVLILDRKYDSALTYRFGIAQNVGKWLTLRAGTFIDRAAAPNCCLSPETPDSDKYGFTLGVSVQATPKIGIDASFQYFEGQERTATNIQNNMPGTYKTRAIAPGLGLSILF